MRGSAHNDVFVGGGSDAPCRLRTTTNRSGGVQGEAMAGVGSERGGRRAGPVGERRWAGAGGISNGEKVCDLQPGKIRRTDHVWVTVNYCDIGRGNRRGRGIDTGAVGVNV